MDKYAVQFGLTRKELDDFYEWKKQKNKEKYGHEENPKGRAAIGGAVTYKFTPTTIGTCIAIQVSGLDEEYHVPCDDW